MTLANKHDSGPVKTRMDKQTQTMEKAENNKKGNNQNKQVQGKEEKMVKGSWDRKQKQ